MKILFWMSHAGFARNFESLLRALSQRGHQVEATVERAVARGPGDDESHLRRLEQELAGLTVTAAPPRPAAGFAETGRHLRAGLDYLRFLEPAYAKAAKPRRRAAGHVPRLLARVSEPPAAREALRRMLSAAERA